MSSESGSRAVARPRRILLRACLALLGSVVLLEGGLRLFVQGDLFAGTLLAHALRRPGRWASSSSDLYWKLVHRWKTSEAPSYMPPHDPRLGWTWWNVEPGTYRHIDEVGLAGRRPVLLFGDSYSACLTSPEECFQGLMERSPLADELLLLNYGVCGYGFDQIYLLVDAALDRHLEQAPIVVVGVLVDDDLNRSLLSLREYPKPRLRVVDGELAEPQTAVPTREEYLAELSGLPASWALALVRGLSRKDPLVIPGSPEQREMGELNRHIVRAIVTRLREREVQFFFLLFHTADSFGSWGDIDWRQRMLVEEFEALEAPWYEVRPEIQTRAAATGKPLDDYFIPDDQAGSGHYNAEGNRAAFDVLRRGLREVSGLDEVSDGPPQPWAFSVERSGGEGGLALYGDRGPGPLTRLGDVPRVVMRGNPDLRLSARYRLDQRAQRFRASLWVFDNRQLDRELSIEARVDGELAWSAALRPSSEVLAVELELQGAQTLEWVLDDQEQGAVLVLSDPQFD